MKSLFVRRVSNRSGWFTVTGVVAVLVAVIFLVGCAQQAAAQLYHCPMHPDYVSDRPGDCPICGMRLVPMTAADRKGHGEKGTPVDRAAGRKSEHGGKTLQADAATASVPGLSAVQTDTERAELAGVRTVAAASDSLVTTIRAVGSVAPDEALIRHVTTKVGGWVERLYVNAVGQNVKAGERLFELYSPELLASQEEYLRARQTSEEFAKSSLPEIRRGGEDLVSSTRRRLELFDVPPEFLDQLDRTGKAQRTIVFRAPFTGYVTDKTVVEGHKVDPGMDLLTVTDLSRVWVIAQLYEAEATAAAPGRAATITLPYDQATTLRGRVGLVYPTVDTESRTIKVRLEFPNTRLALKPGMFVNVELEASRVSGIVVPDSAVIDSGTRQIVFVETAPGHFDPREVQVGARADGKALLRAGVKEGERVAVAANFLLDSESRLRGAALDASQVPASGQHQHAQ